MKQFLLVLAILFCTNTFCQNYTGTYKWSSGRGAYYILKLFSKDKVNYRVSVYAWLNNTDGGAKYGEMCANGKFVANKINLFISNECNENASNVGESGGVIKVINGQIFGDFTDSRGFNIDEGCNGIFNKISYYVLFPNQVVKARIKTDKSYFYENSNENSKLRSYVMNGDIVEVTDFDRNGLAYCSFTNNRGTVTQGFLKVNTLKF